MFVRDAKPDDADFIYELGDLEFTPYGEHGGEKCLRGMHAPRAMTLICEDDFTRQPLGCAIVTILNGCRIFSPSHLRLSAEGVALPRR